MQSDAMRTVFLRCARVGCLIVAAVPGVIEAQQVTLSGVVVDASSSAPIVGARVSVPGSTTVMTDSSGRFRLPRVVTGSYQIGVEATGYLPRSFDVTITADTTLRIEMDALATTLAPMIVRPGTVKINGSIRDATTRQRILWANAILYPGSRSVGALSGDFVFKNVAANQKATIAVEAMEHLPTQITFTPGRDTSVTVYAQIDSVSIRMIAHQAQRLATRSKGVSLSVRAIDRRELEPYSGFTVEQLVGQRLPHGVSLSGECIFYDDEQVKPWRVASLPIEVVDRIEIYGFRASMIRVYTKRYVASLTTSPSLAHVMYTRTGLGVVCK